MLVICGLCQRSFGQSSRSWDFAGGMIDPQLPHKLFQAVHINRWDIR
jgi:hypothetical protein